MNENIFRFGEEFLLNIIQDKTNSSYKDTQNNNFINESTDNILIDDLNTLNSSNQVNLWQNSLI